MKANDMDFPFFPSSVKSLLIAGGLIASAWLLTAAAAPVSLDNGGPAAARVLASLEQSGHCFTPGVRAAYLAFRKHQAAAELATHGITLPADLWRWVDADPIAAATIYGTRRGTPAQALCVLRSLEIDLGPEVVRERHPQLALAAAWCYGASVDLAAGGGNSFSLKPRGPFVVTISPDPRVRVNTRPTDRPLDVHDHIINFLHDEETVTTHPDGTETVAVRSREKPLTAGQVVASLKLQGEFNAYMKRHGQDIPPLDCGDNEINTYKGVIWRHPRMGAFSRAAKLFTEAYIAKGLMVAENDPTPSPTEWIAWQVRNAANPQRATRLDTPWPLLAYVVNHRVPLREAEYVWEEKARGINPMRYIEYIGSIAQTNPQLISLRRLQPFAFTYNSYPGKRLYGGVCGSHTHTNLVAGSAMGLTMVACSSPGHSFPGSIGRDKNGVFAFSGGNSSAPWFFGAASNEGTGSDQMKLSSLAWAMNFGLEGYAASHLAWTLALELPAALRETRTPAVMESAIALNPYNIGLARAALTAFPSPAEQVRFYQEMEVILTKAAATPGCPDQAYLGEFTRALHDGLTGKPLPDDPAVVARINRLLAGQDSPAALRIRYQLAAEGGNAVLASASERLATHLAGTRTVANCQGMALWIAAAADVLTDPTRRKTWAQTQYRGVKDRELYLLQKGGAHEVQTDPAIRKLAELAGESITPPDAMKGLMNQLTGILKAHVAGKRDTPGCKNQAARFRAGVAAAKQAKLDLTPWAAEWFAIMKGKQVYAPHAWTQKDAVSVVLDELIAEYPSGEKPAAPAAGRDDPQPAADASATLAELRAELEALNRDTAGGANQERINDLNRRIDELERKQNPSRK
jgi:hypothetical protein